MREDDLKARAEAVAQDLTHIFMRMGDFQITDLFTNEFMEKYTNFFNFKALQFSSMVWIDWDQDVVATRKSLLDRFIAGSSVFSTWDEMYQKAEEEYIQRTGHPICGACDGSLCVGCAHTRA